jgi:toxoflavin synthase
VGGSGNHFPTVASYLMTLKTLLMLRETRRDKIFVCLTMPGYAKYHSQTGKSPEEYIGLTDGDSIPINEFIALSVFLLTGARFREMCTSYNNIYESNIEDKPMTISENNLGSSKQEKPTITSAYDSFAHLYYKFRQHSENDPFKQMTEYTFFNVLGDVANKSILDLACGTGTFTRRFRSASKVVGVDISEKMIEIARQEEAREPLGIEYLVRDVLELGEIDQFDIVTAGFLLNYSQTKEQLLKMCQNIYANLKPHGRFVTLNGNLDLPAEIYPKHQKYSLIPFTKSISGSLQEGTPITLTFDIDGEQFSFDIYCLSKSTYNWAFQEAGFREINWHKETISPQSIEQFGEEFWRDALDYPMNVYIECVK